MNRFHIQLHILISNIKALFALCAHIIRRAIWQLGLQLQTDRRKWYLWRHRALPGAIPTHGSTCLHSEPLPLGHLNTKSLAVPWALCLPWAGEPCHHDHWASSGRGDVPADSTMLWPSQDPKRPLDGTTNDQNGLKSVHAFGLALLRASLTSTEAHSIPR